MLITIPASNWIPKRFISFMTTTEWSIFVRVSPRWCWRYWWRVTGRAGRKGERSLCEQWQEPKSIRCTWEGVFGLDKDPLPSKGGGQNGKVVGSRWGRIALHARQRSCVLIPWSMWRLWVYLCRLITCLQNCPRETNLIMMCRLYRSGKAWA